jgi:hypothetical protein
MPIYRVDVLVDDPKPVFDWIDEHVPKNLIVRRAAYNTVKGWHVKSAFKRQTDAELFHRHWFPNETVHAVAPFTARPDSQ